jgi:hypothetical protein
MCDLIKRTLKELEGKKRNVYFINADPVDDIPCEAVSNNTITFDSSSSLMMEAFREASI